MRRRTLVIAVVLLGGATLVLFCCGGSDRHASNATETPAPNAAPVAPSPASSAATLVPEPAPSASAAPAASGAASAVAGTEPAPSSGPPGGARIVDAVKSSDPRDPELLASIERELKRDPPPAVHALVAARKRGASRAELASAIRELPELELRVLAERWLDKVAPRPR